MSFLYNGRVYTAGHKWRKSEQRGVGVNARTAPDSAGSGRRRACRSPTPRTAAGPKGGTRGDTASVAGAARRTTDAARSHGDGDAAPARGRPAATASTAEGAPTRATMRPAPHAT